MAGDASQRMFGCRTVQAEARGLCDVTTNARALGDV